VLRIDGVYRPKTLPEALDVFTENPRLRPILGGTDVLVQLTDSGKHASLLDLSLLAELKGIRRDGQYLWIGSAETHTAISESPLIMECAPLVAKSSSIMGSPAIRNRATIGGNVANASPVAESLPTLIAHGAEIVLISPSGKRTMPVVDFHLGPGKSAIGDSEIITGFSIPVVSENFVGFYERLGSRAAVSIAKVGVALAANMYGNRFSEVRIALSAVAPRVIRSPKTERLLETHPLERNLIEEATPVLIAECTPITDFRSTREYRADMVGQLFRMGMNKILNR